MGPTTKAIGPALMASARTGTQMGASPVTKSVLRLAKALTKRAAAAARGAPMRAVTGAESRPPATAHAWGTMRRSAMTTSDTV